MNAIGSGNIAILLQVGPGLASKCELIADALGEAWPGHPPILLALPPGSAEFQDRETIHCRDAGWVSMLRESLLYMKTRHPAVTHLLSLIDDHCPLRPCDGDRLASAIRSAVAEDMKCVAFVTYEWPWSRTAVNSVDERGRRVTWTKVDIRQVGGLKFARVPSDFFRYNQCQPALWDLDYCLSLCEQALALGIDDPWTFESHLFPGQPQHYVSDYRWPTVHHGFMATGQVNAEAVLYARGSTPAAHALGRALVEQFREARGPFAMTRARVAWLMDRIRTSL
ncbi:MAG: hypothetical protein IPL96_02835 [Holophagaceae bacterium]|nr:hypothetical protein [Holophagaceae bacterium]